MDTISLCSSGYPGAHYVGQASLKLLSLLPQPLDARTTGLHCHTLHGRDTNWDPKLYMNVDNHFNS